MTYDLRVSSSVTTPMSSIVCPCVSLGVCTPVSADVSISMFPNVSTPESL